MFTALVNFDKARDLVVRSKRALHIPHSGDLVINGQPCWSPPSATMTALHDRIFASVFPPPSEVNVPTPTATPILRSSGFGEPFDSQHTDASQPGAETGAAEQIKWDRAWHTATTFLSLRDEPINAEQDEETLKSRWIKPAEPDTQKGLAYILSEGSRGRQIRTASNTDDLLRWYFEEVVLEHYVKHVLPHLILVIPEEREDRAVPDTS